MEKIKQYYQKAQLFLSENQPVIRLAFILALAVVLSGMILCHMDFYYVEEIFARDMFGYHMLLAMAAPAVLMLPVWRGYGARIGQILSFLLVPYLAVEAVEVLAGYETVLEENVFWLNVFLAQIIYVIFLLLTQNYRAMMVLGTTAVYGIGLVDHFVHMFRGTPFLPWDIYSVGTAKEVAGAYQIALDMDVLSTLLVMVLAAAIATRFARGKIKWYKRVADVVVLAVTLIFCFNTIYSTGYWYRYGMTINGWDQNLTYAECGTLAGIFMNGKYMYIQTPSGYSHGVVQKITAQYVPPEETAPAVAEETAETMQPHIIVIMNETFADLAVLGDFKTNKSYMNNFYSYQENTVRGNLYVSVLGGTTCNSEFEFLTGNSMYFFGNGYVPYQQTINTPQPSLATILNEQGYTTVAMHPAPAKNWQRNKIYPLLGFDEFLDIDYYEEQQLMRWYYLSDACDYQYLIKRFEEREEDEKMFIFNITIQNHGGYELPWMGVNEVVSVWDKKGKTYNDVSQYLSVIRQSDKELKNLINYFKKVDEPVILCFFGDHQPNLSAEFIENTIGKPSSEFTFEDKLKQYQVPFMIWANYDLEEEYIDATSLNYLGGLLLEKAGIEGNGYVQFLDVLQEQVPAINALGYMTADGVFHEKGAEEEEAAVLDYQKVQYNVLHDKKGRLAELEK